MPATAPLLNDPFSWLPFGVLAPQCGMAHPVKLELEALVVVS